MGNPRLLPAFCPAFSKADHAQRAVASTTTNAEEAQHERVYKLCGRRQPLMVAMTGSKFVDQRDSEELDHGRAAGVYTALERANHSQRRRDERKRATKLRDDGRSAAAEGAAGRGNEGYDEGAGVGLDGQGGGGEGNGGGEQEGDGGNGGGEQGGDGGNGGGELGGDGGDVGGQQGGGRDGATRRAAPATADQPPKRRRRAVRGAAASNAAAALRIAELEKELLQQRTRTLEAENAALRAGAIAGGSGFAGFTPAAAGLSTQPGSTAPPAWFISLMTAASQLPGSTPPHGNDGTTGGGNGGVEGP